MPMNRPTSRVAAAAVALVLLLAAVGYAQTPDCGVLQASTDRGLPNFSGTLPPSADLTTAGGSTWLYVLTQWGFARANLANPANPGPYQLFNVGKYHGNGGVIPVVCDCHQGSNTMAVAQAPDGTARLISDWQPFKQGGPTSGLPAQLVQASGGGAMTFGQQIDLGPNTNYTVPLGSRIAAVLLPNGSYYGYFPTENFGVKRANLTSPTGSTSAANAIPVSDAIGWDSDVVLSYAHVSVPGYDKYLLVGTTTDTIHVAEINTSTGNLTEVAQGALLNTPSNMDVAAVNGHIFIFSAEFSGLQVYEYLFGTGQVSHKATIAGNFKKVIVRGPQPFPALLGHRQVGGSESWIDFYNTNWLTEGGSPVTIKSLKHKGASGIAFLGQGFEALVTQSGPTLTAYLYREVATSPEASIHTDQVDISCIAADPTAPPIPSATMTNLSAATRTSPENGKNYFGDKWHIKDSSFSFLPITELDWDFHYISPNFAAEKIEIEPGPYADFNGYWPCDLLNGGEIFGGVGCYQSLGTITPNYQLALRSENLNPPDGQTFISPAVPLLQPQVSIVGFDGNTLSVLAGNPNNGDASGSQGNVAEAAFNWTFTPSGSASGSVITVPTNATAFSLTATYKGGYSTSKNGSVSQVDLVPNFSLTPNPVLKSSNITLKNLMQKAAAATLNSVDYAISPSGGSGTLPAAFLPVNGTTTVVSPATVGSYTMTLTYHYTDHLGASKTAPVAFPFSVTDFAPSPVVGVYTGAGHTGFVAPSGIPLTYRLTQGHTYYLFDDENLPPGVQHPGAAFFTSNNSNPTTTGDTSIGSSSGYGPVTFNATTACSSNCYLKVSVGGSVSVMAYTVTGGGGGGPPPGCPPNCPPPTPTLSLSGPSAGNVGVAVTFVATATNFSGTVTYEWDFGDAGGGTGGGGDGGGGTGGGGGDCPPVAPNCHDLQGQGIQAVEALTPGPATNSHTYAAAGTFTVTCKASAGSTTKTTTKSIVITAGGPPPPNNTFSVSGATFNPLNNSWSAQAGVPISFTASEPDPAATFAWDFGEGFTLSPSTANRVVSYAFHSGGNPTVVLTVTNANGTSSGSIAFAVSPPSFQAIMIPGAGSIDSASGNWATDVSVMNPGAQRATITLYFASFTDTIPEDLSTLPFDTLKNIPLDAGQSWTGVDVVGDSAILNRHGAGKGLLLLKFTGNVVPIVTARVYFTAEGASFGTALPTYLVGPFGQVLGAQTSHTNSDQVLVGLRNDPLYRFNVSLFNASSQGGLFHLDAFTEQGEQVASRDFAVPAYSQAGVNDTDLFEPNPSKRYVLKVTNSTGALQAFASVLDRRNNDLVQVADDTPRVAAAPGETVDYFISGVGRIEDANTNTHWRTDLRFFNTSAQARDLAFEFHYMPSGSTDERTVLSTLHLLPSQGISIDDFVGTFLNQASETDLTAGTVLGLLKISTVAPTDVATAPLILGGRIYADLSTGTAGMQLATYSNAETSAHLGTLVMPGAQTNLRYRTNIGIFATTSQSTLARITAVRQDGTVASTFDYQLNNPGHTGAFAQIPMTALDGVDGNPTTIKVQSVAGGPVGAYTVTVDQISADTVFVQGR